MRAGVELAVMRGGAMETLSGWFARDRVLVYVSHGKSGKEAALAKRRWCCETWTRGRCGACAKNAAHCKDRRLMRGVVAAAFQGARPCFWQIRDEIAGSRKPQVSVVCERLGV